MRAGRRHEYGDYLTDALSLLPGWAREGQNFQRTLHLDESQHAALIERIKIVADAVQVRPEVLRLDGYTQIRMHSPEGTALSRNEVALAARIEDLYRHLIDPESLS